MPLQSDLREARDDIQQAAAAAHAGDMSRLPIATYWARRLLVTYTPYMAKAAGMRKPDETPCTGGVNVRGTSVVHYAGISHSPYVTWLLTDVPLVGDGAQDFMDLADAAECSDLVICAPAASPEVMVTMGESWHHSFTFLAHHADGTLSMLYQVVK